jgi:hypothetical protein
MYILKRYNQRQVMKVSHYILVIVFFLGLSMLDALIPINLNRLLIAFLIIYLLNDEQQD